MHYSKIFVLLFLLYILYIYSNDEIEKEIRCCITKGEQTLFAQISCNTLIIMIIIGRTLIFLFAIVRCLFAVSTRIFLFLSHPWQRKHLQIYSPLPQCMDRVIQYHSLSIAAELESYSYTRGLKVCHENKKISKNTGHGKNVWKNMRNFTRYI